MTSPNLPTSLYYQENEANLSHQKNFQFSQSIADSGDYTELELRTLNNSEQRRIYENQDRRGTLNIIPNLTNLKNFNEMYQRDSDFNQRSGSNFLRLNSHGALTDVNQSRKLNFDPRTTNLNNSSFSYINTPSSVQIPLNSNIPHRVHEKFGSLIVPNQKKTFHRNSIANIPPDHPSLFQQKRRQRINSGHVSSQYIFNPPSPMTPQKLSNKIKARKSFKVNSLPNIPNNISMPSVEKKEQKMSIFGLKSIKEKHEDEPERKISQSFDGQNSISGMDQQLFIFSKNSQSQGKSQNSKNYSKKISVQSSSNLSNPVNSVKNKSSLYKFSQAKNQYSDTEKSLFTDPLNNSKDARELLLKNFRSFEVEDKEENLQDQQNILFGRNLGNIRNSNKEILADLDIVLQKKTANSNNLLRILSPENKQLGLDLYVNSKSLRKESLTLGKSRSSFFGDKFKISPKIQKKKNIKRKRQKEKLQQNVKLEKNDVSGVKMPILENPYPTSLDSSIRLKSSNLFNFQTDHITTKNTFINQNPQKKSLFENKIRPNKKKFFDLKIKKNIINQSGSEKRLLSPMSHFLSPHPVESTKSNFLFNSSQKIENSYKKYQYQQELNSKFLSNQKPKSKYYSLTPNPKNNNLFPQKNQGLFDKLNKNYQKNMESTPPIRNSNIINPSSYDIPLMSDHQKSPYVNKDLFIPKKISSRRLVNDLNLSHSGAPSSSFINNISGRQIEDGKMNSQMNLMNTQNPFKSAQMGNFMQVKNMHQGTFPIQNNYLQKEFPLIIPQNNQVNYNMRNSKEIYNSGMANNFGQEANLMTFLDPRGSLFQRQYEQKVFGNKPKNLEIQKEIEKEQKIEEKPKNEEKTKKKKKTRNRKRRRRKKKKNEEERYEDEYEERDYYERDYYPRKKRRGQRRYY
jgi:hypothetical protein